MSCEEAEALQAVVVFYGSGEEEFAKSRADYLGHFAANDEWEPIDGVRKLENSLRTAGENVTFYFYDNVGHWFFEENRSDSYDEGAAKLAWDRTLAFLREKLV